MDGNDPRGPDLALVPGGLADSLACRLVPDADQSAGRRATTRLGHRGRARRLDTVHLLDHGAQPDRESGDLRGQVRGALVSERTRMRIIIDVDGDVVTVRTARTGVETEYVLEVPPPEMLEAAARLGATGAGPAPRR